MNDTTPTTVKTVTPGTINQTDFTEVTSKYMDAVKTTADKVKRRKEIVAELEDMIMENSNTVYEGGSYHRYALALKVYKDIPAVDPISEDLKPLLKHSPWFEAISQIPALHVYITKNFPALADEAQKVVDAYQNQGTDPRVVDEEKTKEVRKAFMAKVNELRTVENELEAADLTKRELRDYVSLFRDIKDLVVTDEDLDEDYDD